jgi:hypothetical protein
MNKYLVYAKRTCHLRIKGNKVSSIDPYISDHRTEQGPFMITKLLSFSDFPTSPDPYIS